MRVEVELRVDDLEIRILGRVVAVESVVGREMNERVRAEE